MASLREIKDRIGSVRSTLKITSAMKLVASAKLRKAQKAIEGMRPYERTLAEILAALPAAAPSRAAGNYFSGKFAEKPISAPPSTTPTHGTAAALPRGSSSEAKSASADRPARDFAQQSWKGLKGVGGSGDTPPHQVATAIVAIASNSSLCGGFNANVIRKTLETIRACEGEVEVYPLGRKMTEALRRNGFPGVKDYNDLIGHPSYEKSAALARELARRFEAGELSRVILVYNHFASASAQVPTVEPYLPFSGIPEDAPASSAGEASDDYILEPDPATLVSQLLPQVMMLKFHAAILDSAASEHAARTLAMQTATDNAEDLLGELTLEYNKGRQQKITAEILDLLGGAQG